MVFDRHELYLEVARDSVPARFAIGVGARLQAVVGYTVIIGIRWAKQRYKTRGDGGTGVRITGV